ANRAQAAPTRDLPDLRAPLAAVTGVVRAELPRIADPEVALQVEGRLALYRELVPRLERLGSRGFIGGLRTNDPNASAGRWSCLCSGSWRSCCSRDALHTRPPRMSRRRQTGRGRVRVWSARRERSALPSTRRRKNGCPSMLRRPTN